MIKAVGGKWYMGDINAKLPPHQEKTIEKKRAKLRIQN